MKSAKSIAIFQVDAFADDVFSGNPAAICPLEDWLDDDLMQAIAAENNLSETAFFVDSAHPRLRWFTPKVEVEFCGHATLAAAHVALTKLGKNRDEIKFNTRRGELSVHRREGGWYEMDFPREPYARCDLPAGFAAALGHRPQEIYKGANLMAVYQNRQEIAGLAPDMAALADLCRREDNVGVIATSLGEGDIDFVSRFFAPAHGVDEDPVTGSAHCMLAPYWSERLAKRELKARQISSRGGSVLCALKGERVWLRGKCVDYMKGEIKIEV